MKKHLFLYLTFITLSASPYYDPRPTFNKMKDQHPSTFTVGAGLFALGMLGAAITERNSKAQKGSYTTIAFGFLTLGVTWHYTDTKEPQTSIYRTIENTDGQNPKSATSQENRNGNNEGSDHIAENPEAVTTQPLETENLNKRIFPLINEYYLSCNSAKK